MDCRDVLEPDALRAFAVFAEHHNFTTAAATLHISQPSLHVKIKNLAAALGTQLYERDGRGLRLTDTGEALAAFARDTRRRADDFIAGLEDGAGPLTIAAGAGAFRWVITDAIRQAAAGGRTIHVITAGWDAAVAAVAGGRADIAVVGYDPPPRHLQATQIASYAQVLMISQGHPLGQRDRVRLSDLSGLGLIVPPPGRAHRQALERALLDAGVAWQPAAEADSWELQVHFAGLGIGAAIVNGCIPPPPGLTAVPVAGLRAVRYWATWRPQRHAHIASILTALAAT
jgi:LysR family transcriptional regulator, low CO2-responsive transcriptional regulator